MIEPLSSIVRNLFARRQVPTVGDLIRRAESVRVGAEVHRPPVRTSTVPEEADPSVEPAPTLPPWPVDPYRGIVNGPDLVKRTAWCRAAHHARYAPGPDSITDTWGPFDPNQLGCRYVPTGWNQEAA